MKISLAAARVNAELTQAQAATAMNIDKSTLSSWEKRKTFPKAEQLFSLCALYGCTVNDIFLGEKST